MPTVGQQFQDQILKALKRYTQDLKALSEEARSTSPGGVARTPYDFTYEVAAVSGRMANRIKGVPLSPPSDGWMTAPDEYKCLDKSLTYLTTEIEALGELFTTLEDSDFDREVPMGENPWKLYDIASLCVLHVNYHDGQLCYIQSLNGDPEMHWE